MNVSTFLQESAKFMARDRPDLWNKRTAFNELSKWFSMLAGSDEDGEVGTGGFAMTKHSNEPGFWEYEVHRKVIGFNVFEDEGTSLMNWTEGGVLVDIGLEVIDEEAT